MLKITKKEKSWILYDWANSAFALTIMSTILPIYFTNMVGEVGLSKELATSYWGYTNSIASLIVACLSPLMGGLADYMGMKKKFFTVFSMLGVVFTGLLAFIPYGMWMPLMITYVISLIGFSLSNVFYDSFITDITIESKMDVISSLGFAFGYIGSTIPFILCMGLIMGVQKGVIPLGMVFTTKISFVITAIWWFVFTLPMLKNVEQVHGKPYVKFKPSETFNKYRESFKRVKKNKKAVIFLCAYFFYIDGVDTIIRMAASFGTTLGIDSTTLLVILLVTQFVAFPFAIIYGKLTSIFRAKIMLVVGIIIYMIICVFAFFMTSAREFWILSMLVASSQGGIQALSRSYFAKIIPKENSNEYFGFYNIFGKFAAIMGPALVGIITQLTGNVKNGVLSLIMLFGIGLILLVKNR
ncbi:MFS transporter [Peptostreptococcus canis]|uniref:MFS transporter n=1 Tax=Peptostreptococcus canis TaxID=1159213 RepID=A0ABR6TLB3_9FIRM|nr:MFS transporter [Peptostreptococcus canis]MBP1998283.1 UMF1 family MFS transporter [Peptostreptococcus canis]